MRYWTIVYPDQNSLGEEYTHWETLSDQDILDQYWTYWYVRMIEKNQGVDKLTSEQCIQDWCIVHWAERNYWREMKDNYE